MVGVLGARAFFQILVWDKDTKRAKLLSRYGAEFVEDFETFDRFGYKVTPALRFERAGNEGARYKFKQLDGKNFVFPKGEF